MKQLFFLICLLCSFITSAQKPFSGKLVYTITIADTSLLNMFPPSTMTIYTNDTILRIETHTDQLGKQTLIHHIQKNKGYLLIETADVKYAIQIPEKETATVQKYTFKKAKGKATICGLACKKLAVSVVNYPQSLEFTYHKGISAKYLPGFEHFPGLLTNYYALTTDGLYHHQLVEMSTAPITKDLFGIPSNYQKISMSDFVSLMTGGNEAIIEPEK